MTFLILDQNHTNNNCILIKLLSNWIIYIYLQVQCLLQYILPLKYGSCICDFLPRNVTLYFAEISFLINIFLMVINKKPIVIFVLMY